MDDKAPVDGIDIASIIGGIILIASTTPMSAMLVIPIGLTIRAIRRSEWFKQQVTKIENPLLAKSSQFLLPATNIPETAIIERKDRKQPVNREDLPFWQRIQLPADYDVILDNVTSTPVKEQSIYDMNAAIQRLPKYFSYEKLSNPPTHTSVPIGIDSETKQILWMDLARDLVHTLIAGMTGSGKDALLRLWYVMLTTYNTPEEVQFVILDGKGEWMSAALRASPYMFIPPVGGIDIIKDEKGRRKLGSTERMAVSLDKVFDEIERRDILFQESGATNITSYEKKTGNKLPRIVIIATDVGNDFEGDLEVLVRILTMKARSFGINLIISMQTSSKQDTGWRTNLSLVMSGYLALQSADMPVLGISAAQIKYRPSQLPNPEENDISKGIFVVRRGSNQTLVRTVHLPEEVFEQYTETALLREETRRKKQADVDLYNNAMRKYGSRIHRNPTITPLDLIQQEYEMPVRTQKRYKTERLEYQWALTKEQRINIIQWVKQGWNKTRIMRDGLKYTSGDYYTKYSNDVDKIIETIKRSI